MGASIDTHVLRQIARQVCHIAVERGRVRAVEQHPIVRGHECPPLAHHALGFHGALDAALDLDALDPLLEKPGRRALEQALEEPLDGGQRACHQSASLAAPRSAAGWDHL